MVRLECTYPSLNFLRRPVFSSAAQLADAVTLANTRHLHQHRSGTPFIGVVCFSFHRGCVVDHGDRNGNDDARVGNDSDNGDARAGSDGDDDDDCATQQQQQQRYCDA